MWVFINEFLCSLAFKLQLSVELGFMGFLLIGDQEIVEPFVYWSSGNVFRTTSNAKNKTHTQVTDAGLEHIKGLTRLQNLYLFSTQVTDAGLESLKGLDELLELRLDNTKVTDAGLEHIKGLTQLERLYLDGTKVTDEGVKKLQQALPNCKIKR